MIVYYFPRPYVFYNTSRIKKQFIYSFINIMIKMNNINQLVYAYDDDPSLDHFKRLQSINIQYIVY